MMATNFIVHMACLFLALGMAFWIFRLQSAIHSLRLCFRVHHVIDWLPLALRKMAQAAGVEFECELPYKESSPQKIRVDRVLESLLRFSVQKMILSRKGLTIEVDHGSFDCHQIFQEDLGISIVVQHLEKI
ncbi:MAG: hypothetical protein AB8C84_12580 [Oligoflexales bacterium]